MKANACISALAAASGLLALTVVVTACGLGGSSADAANGIGAGGDDAGGGGLTALEGGADAGPSSAQDAATSSDAQSPTSSHVTATFRTIDAGQYLSATNGGGGALTAASNTPGGDETFTLVDGNGGALNDGDPVYVVAAGGQYLSAANGGGGALAFDATTPGADETFILVRLAGAGMVATGDSVALATKVTGNFVSAINGGGGQVLANAPWDRAWETYVIHLGVPSDGGSPSSAAARQKVLSFLAGISGHRAAIGIENKDSAHPQSDSDHMASMAGNGQNPSFWSADWGFGSGAVDNRESIVQEGEKQWGEGALVQYIYHACPLTMDEYCQWTDINRSSLTDAQWKDLLTPGGTLNQAWLARLDTLAKFFQELKDAGVAPLFRPLHEMNGSWAWWQRPGPNGSPRLYQITHDYLVETKGLDNIIWVWNVQDYTTLASDVTSYNPGAGYFDIAALDVYDTGYTQANYDAMVGAAGGKPIGIAECQYLPPAATLAQQPLWSYVAMWPDFYSDNTSSIPALFNDPTVMTLSQMAGWK